MSYGTLASASRTFMCPGRRPATGWIPNRTSFFFALNLDVNSETALCACATAIP